MGRFSFIGSPALLAAYHAAECVPLAARSGVFLLLRIHAALDAFKCFPVNDRRVVALYEITVELALVFYMVLHSAKRWNVTSEST